MTAIKRLACAGLLLLTLFAAQGASPALSACPPSAPDCVAAAVAKPNPAVRIGQNFLRGTAYYFDTVGGWFKNLLALFGFDLFGVGKAENAPCDDKTSCGPGLACLNVCSEITSCNTLFKRCVKAPANLLVQFQATGELEIRAPYTSCGTENLCGGVSVCTRTCPDGVNCPVTHRCLPPEPGGGACGRDNECLAVCRKRGFPPVGTAAIRAACQQGTCRCLIEEADPNLNRVACPDPAAVQNVICLGGTAAACTADACAKPGCHARPTCLTAPELGGQCLNDAECGAISCAAGAAPFCDADRRCRCRSFKSEVVGCSADAECAAIPCDPGQAKACVAGTCACAISETTETEKTACATDSECPQNCPTGYVPACRDGACGCQRTAENVPVSCTAVTDCGAVSCPAGYEKACLNNQCACTRTTTQ